MKVLVDRLRAHEEWLMDRVLAYARKYGYTAYTSTLLEPWRVSIVGITDSIEAVIV